MGRGSVAQRLVDFVQSGVGSVRGSLGVTTVGTATIFGAISGVSAAAVRNHRQSDVSGDEARRLSRAIFRRIDHRGWRIDIIIPPSIPMIVYGAAAEESVPRLYAPEYSQDC